MHGIKVIEVSQHLLLQMRYSIELLGMHVEIEHKLLNTTHMEPTATNTQKK